MMNFDEIIQAACENSTTTSTTTTTTTTSTTTTTTTSVTTSTTSTTTTCADVEISEVSPDILSNSPSLFGSDIAAGLYQVAYIEGAMKYTEGGEYALNLSAAKGFRIVHSNGSVEIEGPKTDYDTFPTQGGVEGNNAGAVVTFNHSGGPIYMWLEDDNYEDNESGSTANPTFQLSRI